MQQLQYTCALVRESQRVLLGRDGEMLSIVMLEAVAKARYGLTVCAQWFYRLYIEQNVERELNRHVRELCDAASYLCDQNQLQSPR